MTSVHDGGVHRARPPATMHFWALLLGVGWLTVAVTVYDGNNAPALAGALLVLVRLTCPAKACRSDQ